MEIPLFPLHSVLFPGAQMPIVVFEPRYRALLDRVLAGDRTFGVAAIRQGMEVGGPAQTYAVGCVASIEQMKRDPSGSSNIVVSGRTRFRIVARLPDNPYPIAEIEPIDELIGVAPDLTATRAALHRYLSVVAQLQGIDVAAPTLPEDIHGASFAIAAALQLDLAETQRLLECDDTAARLRLAAELARKEAALLEAIGPSVGRPAGQISMN